MAGLPGTGLGGIFYVLLVMWMGPSGPWARIAWLGSLAATIVTALWVEGLGLQELIRMLPGAERVSTHRAAFALDALAPAVAVAPFVILAMLLLSLQLARLILRPRRQAEAPAAK